MDRVESHQLLLLYVMVARSGSCPIVLKKTTVLVNPIRGEELKEILSNRNGLARKGVGRLPYKLEK